MGYNLQESLEGDEILSSYMHSLVAILPIML